jgi:hypothetical protein
VYEVTEEFYVHNGRYGTREDIVFLINGIPVLVIECKNATKEEAIALGVDQIRRYHTETPEVMVPEMLFTATEAIGFAYGATWSLVRRNIFNWKHEEVGNLEAKVKSFCDVPQLHRRPRAAPESSATTRQGIKNATLDHGEHPARHHVRSAKPGGRRGGRDLTRGR